MENTITDLITKAEAEKWKPDDIVIITAGTGKGKSYFIKNRLYEIAKENGSKILFLIHRLNCIKQFQYEVDKDGKSDIIHIRSYQSIDVDGYNGNKVDLSEYMYIVSDEFHYFISDASFNYFTDISFKQIIETRSAVRIFMSATGDEVINYIKREGFTPLEPYIIKSDFNFIDNLRFFTSDDLNNKFDEYIYNALNNNEKAIVFIDNTDEAYKLYKKHKPYALLNCSESNNMYNHVNTKKIEKMLYNEKFDESILITTSVMDAGVNIRDEKVKHIILDIKDFGSLIQCLGRKRILNENDKVNVYIRIISNQRLSSMKRSINLKLEKAECLLLKKSMSVFLEKYKRNTEAPGLIYDVFATEQTVSKKVNMMMFYKFAYERIMLHSMIKFGDGYSGYVANYFGRYCNGKYECESKDKRADTINELRRYLHSMVGVEMLQTKDRAELISKLNVKKDGKQKSSIDLLNGELKSKKLPYQIIKKSVYKHIDGKSKQFQNAWLVEQVDIGD